MWLKSECNKSQVTQLENGHPKVALSKDKQTVVMYHPKTNLDYSKTIPIPRDEKRYTSYSTANDIVRGYLNMYF